MNIGLVWVCLIAINLLAAAGATVLQLKNGKEGRRRGCFSAIYSFGDSLTDTGNALLSYPDLFAGHLPYGETFFHRPTGRYSDGRIILDFIAEACGMPLLDPYLDAASPHEGGINFAVGGSTANNVSYFEARNITLTTNLTLAVQLNWFLRYKSKLCAKNPKNCSQHLQHALFVVGEIGGNDYNSQLWGANPASLDQAQNSIGDVVAAIQNALETLIQRGFARKIVVPNNLPVGCSTSYLSQYPREARDSVGCMPRFNRFAMAGNMRLQQMLENLQSHYGSLGVRIVQADYYGAAMQVLNSAPDFGIQERFLACCGEKGTRYRFNGTNLCGTSRKSNVCWEPSRYFSFDGIHLTEAAYRAMASLLLDPSLQFASPPIFGSLCQGSVPTSASSSPANCGNFTTLSVILGFWLLLLTVDQS